MTDEPKEQTIGGMLDRLPAWAQIGLVLYNLAGLPTCILVYNALENAGVIPNVVDERLTAIESGMQQDAGHAIRHDATMQELVKHMQDSAKQKQKWCVKKAATDDERMACLEDK
jgi:hypothetical protein